MGEHLLFSEGLKPSPNHAAIAATYLGQAHIAGTGPEGKTCRECVFWFVWKTKKEAGVVRTVASDPGHFGKRHEKTPCELKKARCNKPILNKANRLIPHHAPSCRLFEQSDNPAPAKRVPDAR